MAICRKQEEIGRIGSSALRNGTCRTEGWNRRCKDLTECKSVLAGTRRQHLLTVPTFAAIPSTLLQQPFVPVIGLYQAATARHARSSAYHESFVGEGICMEGSFSRIEASSHKRKSTSLWIQSKILTSTRRAPSPLIILIKMAPLCSNCLPQTPDAVVVVLKKVRQPIRLVLEQKTYTAARLIAQPSAD